MTARVHDWFRYHDGRFPLHLLASTLLPSLLAFASVKSNGKKQMALLYSDVSFHFTLLTVLVCIFTTHLPSSIFGFLDSFLLDAFYIDHRWHCRHFLLHFVGYHRFPPLLFSFLFFCLFSSFESPGISFSFLLHFSIL